MPALLRQNKCDRKCFCFCGGGWIRYCGVEADAGYQHFLLFPLMFSKDFCNCGDCMIKGLGNLKTRKQRNC